MLDIAIGQSRHQKNWINKKMTWESLVLRISKTHYTAETYTEYENANKDRQSEIKDVGGFVGGYLIDGRRKPENVKHRQILTLDIDFAHVDMWDDFQMLYDCTALIYSTHKHSQKTPRYRIVLPLARAVNREEYEAISRRIAGNLGIGHFDSTGFQFERLMYWPSTSKDGEYFFRSQEGEFLSPDVVLASYHDWRNISEWPICNNEKNLIKSSAKKQENPTEKKGMIGAFCRAFTITEAMAEFIPEAYVQVSEDRYTYTEGSTAGGAIVYDDLFLYSHHSTDPACGTLCNAFDLVRLHKFGHLDGDDDTLPATKKESFKATMNLISSHAKVIKEIGVFNDLPAADWLGELEINNRGEYEHTIDNLYLILTNDDNLKGVFAFNQFEYRDFITRWTPWNASNMLRYATDKDDAGLRHYVESTYGIHNAIKLRDAVDLVSLNNGFHPVREYIEGLKWDGKHRLDRLFIDTLGAIDTPYTRAVTRKALTAAIARIFQPGIKFDYVLTLVGDQGLGKSTLFHELGGEWFSDSMGNLQTKEATEQIQGSWIIEMAELAGLKKTEIEVVKHFITKQTDKFRVAYGRRVESFPRQCVFFGTTNETSFLRDATGNRRFWPVSVTHGYKGGGINVDQIWAEAKNFYLDAEPLFLTRELENDAEDIQRNHAEQDDRIGMIESYLETLLPKNWDDMHIFERRSFLSDPFDPTQTPGTELRDKVCVAEIWCEVLKGDFKDMTNNNTKFIHSILQNLKGWERGINKRYSIYGAQRSYFRKVGIKKRAKV